MDRNSAWAPYVKQNDHTLFDASFYNPAEEDKHVFKNKRPEMPESVRIYEAHVGMSSEGGRVNSFRDFADNVLPHIKKSGYNVV
jgi:1,4-alpha-glucan branching enzyme